MTDGITKLSEALRPLSWPARATHLDETLGGSFAALLRGDPAITGRDALSLLRANFGPVIRQLDESEIGSLDQAMMLVMFVPERTEDAARWSAENAISGDDALDWLDDHPGYSLTLKLLTRFPANVVTVH